MLFEEGREVVTQYGLTEGKKRQLRIIGGRAGDYATATVSVPKHNAGIYLSAEGIVSE